MDQKVFSSPHYQLKKLTCPALISFRTPYNLSVIHGYLSCFDEVSPYFQFYFLILTFLQKFMNSIDQYLFRDNFLYKVDHLQDVMKIVL